MGNLNSLLQLLTTCLILSGCVTEEINDTDLGQNIIEKNNKIYDYDNVSNKINTPIESLNELIIEYPEDRYTTETQRAFLRQKHGVIRYETCDCSNKKIEKWVFGDGVDIEEEEVDIAEEGIGVENEFYYKNSYPIPTVVTNIEQSIALIQSNIVSKPSQVTIATLDTGIDLNQLPNTGPFLYKLRPNDSICVENGKQELSGWDFVNHDNNPHDDNGHGTIVTSIIKSGLVVPKIDFEILPVKVFDHEGEGSYFTLLCGYKYATSKPSVSIINMSFGWYYKRGRLLNKYISQNNHILHVTSAGNDSINNDMEPHFPSSYRHAHNVAIGSIDVTKTEIADFSNYGTSSVDFLSLGDRIVFYDSNGEKYVVSGTSYAAPFVTAKSAIEFINGHRNPQDILKELLTNATPLGPGTTLPVRCKNKIID